MQEEERSNLELIIGQKPYKPLTKLSYGSYGQIFKILCIKDDEEYVIKVVSKQKMIKEQKLHEAVVQGYLLSKLNHPFIIKYLETLETKKYISQILEFCPHGDFFNLMKKVNRNMDLLKKKQSILNFYIAELVSGLSFLHAHKIVHRDVKPENIVIGKDFHLRIIDFGTAKTLQPLLLYNKKQIQLLEKIRQIKNEEIQDEEEIARRGSFVGSASYISPESISMKHSLASDIWSLGVIIYKAFHNRLPFDGQNNYLIFKKIKTLEYTMDSNLPEEVKDLISICLRKDPEERPSIEVIKKHGYFKNVEFENLWKESPPVTEKDLRLTEIEIKPVKKFKMEVVLEKQMFFGNYKPRILKMYDRESKLYMSYWYLDKNVPKNQFQMRINDYAESISKNEFQVKNDDVKYVFRVGSQHNVSQVVEQINVIIRKFYDLD